ncbi:hypothetical protein [Microlunatus flavus]|uniref:Uncharacterized protein n=1 Tax=Microlunatus flavus TaxID=1036181 RepID=A0A1H9KLA0_9ACTN|nr:hypothetical protein [Microlunatus flavus]SEQ99920.1 hypothetical protein SAMN05421756_107267 [Microlunatus flavus]
MHRVPDRSAATSSRPFDELRERFPLVLAPEHFGASLPYDAQTPRPERSGRGVCRVLVTAYAAGVRLSRG